MRPAMTNPELRAAALASKAWPYEEARKLLKRWPEKGGEAPWPAPIRDTGMGHWLRITVRNSDIEDAGDELVEIAHEHRLLVLDPQEREVIAPE